MQTGDRVGRYLLEQKLGEGAMACVFAARHSAARAARGAEDAAARGRQRSTVWPIASSRMRVRRRRSITPTSSACATSTSRTACHSSSWNRSTAGTLERLLADRGRLEVAEAATIARDIALALGAAHASGIVHRDVKPSNVLIDRRSGTAKLTDFGAAKRERPPMPQALTAHGQTVGTPRYMAPEQINGDQVDARTDLWALGATLHEMLAGRPAFQAGSLAKTLSRHLAGGAPVAHRAAAGSAPRADGTGRAPARQVGRPAARIPPTRSPGCWPRSPIVKPRW